MKNDLQGNFTKENIYNLLIEITNDKIKDLNLLEAHRPKEADINKENEKLLKHMSLTIEQIVDINDKNYCLIHIKNLINDLVDKFSLNYINITKNIKEKCKDGIFKAFVNAIYLHDLGKISVKYQLDVLNNNNKFTDMINDGMTSNHSFYSAILYINEMCLEFKDNLFEDIYEIDCNELLIFLLRIIYNFSFEIYKHHSGLDDLNEFYKGKFYFTENDCNKSYTIKFFKELCLYNNDDILENFIDTLFDVDNFNLSVFSGIEAENYLLNKLLYSMIVVGDSLATSKYMNDTQFEIKDLDIHETVKAFNNTETIRSIKEHFKTGKFNGTINEVRCNMFKESEEILNKSINNNIFFLEAPTGAGKTIMSTNISLKIMKLTQKHTFPIKKYVYTAPFNSICNQTADNLNKLFKDYNPIDIIEINSNTSINKVYNEEYDIDYDLSILDYQMINYGITLTSHVKLFKLLFSNLRNNNLSLIHLFNSVIVLDEIQAYRVDIWAEIIRILDVYAKYMNIKFVIMSATLPDLSKLLDTNIAKSSYKNLIKNTEIYFKNTFFKDRISEYDYSLLDKYKDTNYEDKKINIYNDILSKINELIKENKNVKILVEFIKKQTCRNFYEFLNKNKANILQKDMTIREITSEDNKYYRDSVIEEGKILENIIIVSTQTIEAGVDIDMDFGFKDISFIYNEEQFIGRINRSSTKKNSKVFFFNLDDADKIYKNEDYIKGLNVLNLTYRKCLEDKNFSKMFDDIMKRIKKQKESSNIYKSINIFLQHLENLEFKKVDKDLTLIKEKEEFMLFLPLDMSIKENISDKIIDKNIKGKDIWAKLKNIVKQNYDYSKFKVEKSEILSEMNYFTYKYEYYNGKDNFESFLISKGFKIDNLNNIYFLDLNENELETLIDKDYKFNKNAFNNFIKK